MRFIRTLYNCKECDSITITITANTSMILENGSIHCGLCGNKVIAASTFAKGNTFYGSDEPLDWLDKLHEFSDEGLIPFEDYVED